MTPGQLCLRIWSYQESERKCHPAELCRRLGNVLMINNRRDKIIINRTNFRRLPMGCTKDVSSKVTSYFLVNCKKCFLPEPNFTTIVSFFNMRKQTSPILGTLGADSVVVNRG